MDSEEVRLVMGSISVLSVNGLVYVWDKFDVVELMRRDLIDRYVGHKVDDLDEDGFLTKTYADVYIDHIDLINRYFDDGEEVHRIAFKFLTGPNQATVSGLSYVILNNMVCKMRVLRLEGMGL